MKSRTGSEARHLGTLRRPTPAPPAGFVRLQGSPASPGSASGPVFVLDHRGGGPPVWPDLPSVIVAPRLSLEEAAGMPARNVLALVTAAAGDDAAGGIVASELGAPVVAGVAGVVAAARAAQGAEVDGSTGRVLLSARRLAARANDPGQALRRLRLPLTLMAAVHSAGAAAEAMARGSRGIGRLELEHLQRLPAGVPSEHRQELTYRSVAAAAAPYAARVLAWRAAPAKPAATQVRALVAAAADWPNLALTLRPGAAAGGARLAAAAKARSALGPAGVAVGLELGAPADLLQIPTLVGSVEYVDLDLDRLVDLATGGGRGAAAGLEPGVLRLLQEAVADSARLGIEVAAHGDLAMDPAGAVFLAGVGVGVLTMPVARFRGLEEALDGLSREACRHAAHGALGSLDAGRARAVLDPARLDRAPFQRARLSL